MVFKHGGGGGLGGGVTQIFNFCRNKLLAKQKKPICFKVMSNYLISLKHQRSLKYSKCN